MWYVYILESESHSCKFYTGFTDDLKRRLKEHNADNNKGIQQNISPGNYIPTSHSVIKRLLRNLKFILRLRRVGGFRN